MMRSDREKGMVDSREIVSSNLCEKCISDDLQCMEKSFHFVMIKAHVSKPRPNKC